MWPAMWRPGSAGSWSIAWWTPCSAGSTPGGRRPGGDQLAGEARRADQAGPLRPAGEQRLRALVDGYPGDLGDGELAAQPRRALQEGNGYRRIAQEERGGQASDAATDDHDPGRGGGVHPTTLAERAGGSEPGCHTSVP